MANIQQHFELVKQRFDRRDMESYVNEILVSLEDEMARLNRDQIFETSQDVDGDPIGFYSEATEEITGGEKRAGEPFTGRDTGEWLDRFFAVVSNNLVNFGSTDPKTDDILESEHWLSRDLFGLTVDNKIYIIQEKAVPLLQEIVRKKLLS